MKLALMMSALMSAGLAFAEPVLSQSVAQDEVAASFERMLADRPIAAVEPIVRENDDPLRVYISAVLWERQPTQCQFARHGAASRALAPRQRVAHAGGTN